MASLNNVVWAICQYNACLPWHLHTPVQDFCLTLEDATEAINQTFPKINLSPFVDSVDSVFSNAVYYIDFYQRDYKWTAVPVQRLLDDIYYPFGEKYQKHADVDPSKESVADKYPWYYLNTYVTNVIEGRVYVVGDQQCLTKLALILL
jgi:uncharacterized protein with ParB-like and HNH nuclease domain